jgi:hypothetical protein
MTEATEILLQWVLWLALAAAILSAATLLLTMVWGKAK